jgi:hypothetical protein
MMEMKGQAVVHDMAAGGAGGVIGTLLPIILQILQSLLGAGGTGLCKPTSGGAVRSMLSRPARMRRRQLAHVVAQYIDDPTTQSLAIESIQTVRDASTDDELWKLYGEANPTS